MADTAGRMDTWSGKWAEGKIAFHRTDVNPHLMKWCYKLAHDDTPTTFLVPLCGKSVDMIWLYKKGHTVIGIEGVEKAILEFFAENDLKFTKTPTGSGNLFQTADGRLRLYQADICEISPDLTGPVQAIWDRGSYVAVNYEDRPVYAQFMRGVMAPGCKYLLWAVEYDTSRYPGPPRSLTEQDIKRDFGSHVKIECLSSESQTVEAMPRIANWNLEQLQEVVYLLTPK